MSDKFPTLGEATRVWAKIAALSFGGPAGQMAVMHRILVEEKRWLGEQRFLHALNFCMLLPGPEAQQLVTYVGWLMHGVRGGLIAGLLFILPGMLSILALSVVYVLYGDVAWVSAVFFGLKAAVLAIVVQAVIRLAGRALKTWLMRGLAAASFVGIFVFGLPFPLIILAAALVGWITVRGGAPEAEVDADTSLLANVAVTAERKSAAFRAGWAALAAWLLPVMAVLLLAPESVLSEIAVFFSTLATLTFGGAYAALAWVAQDGVGVYGWLTASQMVDGLGLAETTPGPLIMVLQFVGFLAGYGEGLSVAIIGALLTTWVTFAPCFVWIFFGAPFMERLRTNRRLQGALKAVTAAVVGVIMNIAIWFAIHVIWSNFRVTSTGMPVPDLSSIQWDAAALCVLAGVMVLGLKWGIGRVLLICAVCGLALSMV
ncbi:chromate efflux transporter [Marivivens aquimaris]|uniref:chromate efflux transporter n=1 Tax=Marivivens aquimaris TaxID=2774876 RepID=UPI00187E9CDC|nr:chromate efflux transporter [Marivivens aquimaris]